MGVSLNDGTQQPWVFLLKMIILGCEMGVPPFKETPIWQQNLIPWMGPGWGGGYLPFDPEAQDDECLEPGDAAGGATVSKRKLCEAARFFYRRICQEWYIDNVCM